jgi:outer membrane protein OmpA-like peptidoglycan-associated protein
MEERASAGRIETVSYGEERPIALGYSEDVYGYTG